MYTVLMNDYGNNDTLTNEHGFSLLITDKEKNILFDTGLSQKTLDNAGQLNVDIQNIDAIVISHGHYDHIGGLKFFMDSINKDIPVFASDKIFIEKYKYIDKTYSYIGYPKILISAAYKKKFILFPKTYKITDRLILAHIKKDTSYKEKYFFIKQKEYIPDYFNDEIILIINDSDGISIISGCSHSKLNNIINTAIEITGKTTIKSLIGGFHLSKVSDKVIIKTAEDLKNYTIHKIAVCHCSGKNAYEIFKQKLPGTEIFWCNTGDTF